MLYLVTHHGVIGVVLEPASHVVEDVTQVIASPTVSSARV